MDHTNVDPPIPPILGELETLTQADKADWGDDKVKKVVETEIEDFQSQALQPTEASHTTRLPNQGFC